MTSPFGRRPLLRCLALIAWTGVLAACAAAGPSPAGMTPTRPPSPAGPVSTAALPTAALAPSSTLLPSPRPTWTRWPSYTPAPSPTLVPTGISPASDHPGQNPYSAVVSYPGPLHTRITMAIHFLLYLPSAYGQDPARRWPLLIYLHGSGSRGNDLSVLKKAALVKNLEVQPDFPFIVISPQCPANYDMWSGQIDALDALIDLVLARYPVDPQRITLTGFSMGGFGTWEFAMRYPQRFAAIAPVAGGYIFQSDALPSNLCDLKDLPVWVFHGAEDTSVVPEQDLSLVAALKACRGNVRLTYYADAGHNLTAERAYATPELFQWLAAQSRPS